MRTADTRDDSRRGTVPGVNGKEDIKDVRIGAKVPEAFYLRVQAQAEVMGVSIASLIRIALTSFIAREQEAAEAEEGAPQ